MLNTQTSPLGRLFRSAFVMPLLAVTYLVSPPSFGHNPVDSAPIGRVANEPRPGDDIYLVIKPQLTKELLNNAVSTLKTKGITLAYANDEYKNGKLVAIDVTIDVEVPGKPKTTYRLSETGSDSGVEPMIFYYESEGARMGFTREVPADLSHRGKLVVTDNLVGMAILNGDNMQVHGGIRTTWK